jgi:hypothetical protein
MNIHLRTLLRLIKANADSTFLLSQGFSYSQISELFVQATREEFIEHDGERFQVTEKGADFLIDRKSTNILGSFDPWVSPDDRFLILKMGKDEIFLPTVSESKVLAA